MASNVYQRLAFYLLRENNLPQEKALELAYAMETITVNMLNLLLTSLVGLLIGVLPGTLVCILVATLYRHTAGGAHSRSPWICAGATMIIYPALAYLGSCLATGPDTYSWIIVLVAAIIGLYAIYRYAPVDSVQAPIVSPIRRKRLRKYSYLVITSLIVVILILEVISIQYGYQRSFQFCVALTILWVSFNLTGLAHTLWRMLDNQHNSIGRR